MTAVGNYPYDCNDRAYEFHYNCIPFGDKKHKASLESNQYFASASQQITTKTNRQISLFTEGLARTNPNNP